MRIFLCLFLNKLKLVLYQQLLLYQCRMSNTKNIKRNWDDYYTAQTDTILPWSVKLKISCTFTWMAIRQNYQVMIKNTQPELATINTDYSLASRTCGRSHVTVHGDGRLLIRIILIFCCVVMSCGDFKNKIGYCNLDPDCDWSWNQTDGFQKYMASQHSNLSRFFPITDADKSTKGITTLS